MSDRELDRKVATILGTCNSVDLNPADVPYMQSGMVDPHYSSDFAALPEMLAWLQARTYEVVMGWSDKPPHWFVTITHNNGREEAMDHSLLVSVCRGVVAVAERAK